MAEKVEIIVIDDPSKAEKGFMVRWSPPSAQPPLIAGLLLKAANAVLTSKPIPVPDVVLPPPGWVPPRVGRN